MTEAKSGNFEMLENGSVKIKGQTHRSAPTENVGVNPCVHPEFILEK